MRLLAFLTSLETALRTSGSLDSAEPCSRHVDYTRGNARMRLDEERAIVLHLHRMASGRVCLRVNLEEGESLRPVHSIYPEVDDFSWDVAIDDVVRALRPLLVQTSAAVADPKVVNA